MVADLKAQWKKKDIELYSFCHNTKMDREKSCFEKYYKNGSYVGFCKRKINGRVFVSTVWVKATPVSELPSTAEHECGDGL
jgi:hypothetical protein